MEDLVGASLEELIAEAISLEEQLVKSVAAEAEEDKYVQSLSNELFQLKQTFTFADRKRQALSLARYQVQQSLHEIRNKIYKKTLEAARQKQKPE